MLELELVLELVLVLVLVLELVPALVLVLELVPVQELELVLVPALVLVRLSPMLGPQHPQHSQISLGHQQTETAPSADTCIVRQHLWRCSGDTGTHTSKCSRYASTSTACRAFVQ